MADVPEEPKVTAASAGFHQCKLTCGESKPEVAMHCPSPTCNWCRTCLRALGWTVKDG